ncbi:CYTH and CHAD domain-containing protein [Gephyromycinifex aptenodytis]|uniref:CYTH and CHAD domain-containing protein n=1 Tax=Gephyromycinifex aptenodytis TaxID=2716227 RepID=UPI001445C47D|nr:CYTH and CHAD domain-containing protein [Gephyromycinifex aptenodytis]
MADDIDPNEAPAPQVEIEKELKFEVPRRWSMPSLVGMGRVQSVSQPRRMTQSATYIDTPDLDLLRGRCTLRRRTGGTDAGWHLKTPGDEKGRVEHRLPLGRSAVFVPGELRSEVADLIGSKPLVPVALLRTRRTRRELAADDGTVLLLVEDDVVEATTYLDGERVHRWREVEVELVEGDETDLRVVADALLERGLTHSDSPSKLSRALAQPLAQVRGKKGDKSAGDVVLRYIGKQVGVLQSSEAEVRADAPDAVHRARVATRRLRSALRSYRRILNRTETDPLRAEIAWLTGVLGEPRDAEVMRERLLRLADTLEPELVVGPVLARLRDTLEAEHRHAHEQLVRALDSQRYERLLADLTDLIINPALLPAAEEPAESALPELVAKASSAVSKQADKARVIQDEDEREEAIHDVRKRAKAARYAAEAAGKATGGAGKLADAWTELQEALGDHQDSVVSRGVILRLAHEAREAGEDTFTYGVLAEREYAFARGVEARYTPLLKGAIKASKRLGC